MSVLRAIIGSVTYDRRTLERSVKIIDESERDELVRKAHRTRPKPKKIKRKGRRPKIKLSGMHGKWMKNVYGK